MKRLPELALILIILGLAESKDHVRLKRAMAENSDTDIKFLHVESKVVSRFATTHIRSEVQNLKNEAQEIFFEAQLPSEAFISNFTIPRKTDIFRTSVTVKANGKVKFDLTYQEILVRVHGVYKHVVNILSTQGIEDVKIDVIISERGKLTKLKVPKFAPKIAVKTNKELLALPDNSDAFIKQSESNGVTTTNVSYTPAAGKSGQLAVLYDVERTVEGGEIEVFDGCFVHFFAPPSTFLDSVSADFVFVLDKSGSMSGRKFSQMQEAMRTILPQLKEEDRFSLVYFSGDIVTWENTLQQANEDNIDRALEFIDRRSSSGSTNIYGGIVQAMSILEKSSSEEEEEERPAVIVFLTDGHPTAGKINDPEGIKLAIRQRNKDKIKIHTLAFGDDADSTMLKQLSQENNGLYRKIFVASDAALQLDGFYSEIATPVLSNLKVTYLNSSVMTETIIKNRDDGTLYGGSELVIIGKLKKPNVATLKGEISAKKSDGEPVSFRSGNGCFLCCSRFCPGFCGPRIQCNPIHSLVPVLKVSPAELPPNTLGGVIERMWAYQTIKKNLMKAEFNTEKSPTLRNEAKNLAIKHNFVTELTSLIIVDKEAELKPSEDAEDSEADLGLGTIAPTPSGLGLTHESGGASSMCAFMRRMGSFDSGSGGGCGGRSQGRFGGASTLRRRQQERLRSMIAENRRLMDRLKARMENTRPGFSMRSKESELFSDFRSKLSKSGKIDGKLVLAYLTSDSGDVEIKLFEQISTRQSFSTNRKTIENILDTLNHQKGNRHIIFIHGRQMIPSSLKKLIKSQNNFTIISAIRRENITSMMKMAEALTMSPYRTVFNVNAGNLFNKLNY